MLTTLLALTFAAPAWAGSALSMSGVLHAQDGFSIPSMAFLPEVNGRADVRVTCADRTYSWAGQVAPGETVKIQLEGLPVGKHACTGRVDLITVDGEHGESPISVTVQVHPPLKVTTTRDRLDLAKGIVTVNADRPLGRLEVEAFGPQGVSVGTGAAPVPGNSTSGSVQWTAEPGAEVLKVVVKAWDVNDLPGQVELRPWSYAIPHDDVVFGSGKSNLTPSEAPKLEKAWKELQAVLERYGEVAEVQLFVAGYTDTVGDKASNQVLSEQRARAIADWFKARGFNGPVHYQGFGEGALAVPTGDEVDEARNRRALYLLAAEEPPVSKELPKASWKEL